MPAAKKRTRKSGRFLNVTYGGRQTEINIKDFERLVQVSHAIKDEYGADIPAPSARIQLYDVNNAPINRLDGIHEVYFKELSASGLSLTIRISPVSCGPVIPQNLRVPLRQSGIHLKDHYMLRAHLVIKMKEYLNKSRVLVLSSPWASGKTSLLQLFENVYRASHRCISISFQKPKGDAVWKSGFDLLREHGLDLRNEECILRAKECNIEIGDTTSYFMIDYAHKKYSEKDFWDTLLNKASSWLPSNVKFIISVPFTPDSQTIGTKNAAAFHRLPRLARDDFLVRRVNSTPSCITYLRQSNSEITK